MKYSLIVFDWDGTLIDSTATIAAAIAHPMTLNAVHMTGRVAT